MFTKKPDRDATAQEASKPPTALRPAAPPAQMPQMPNARPTTSGRASGAASVIGADLTITGNLESKGEVQVEGAVQGDIYAQRIIIGERARITGALIASGSIDVLVVDSVAALVPKAELDGEMGDSHMGLQARLMSQALRKLTGVVSKSKTCRTDGAERPRQVACSMAEVSWAGPFGRGGRRITAG